MGDKTAAAAVGGGGTSAEGHEDCGACGNDGMEADKDGGPKGIFLFVYFYPCRNIGSNNLRLFLHSNG